MKNIYLLSALAALSLTACEPDLRSEAPTANGLDFSNYVAIGNSLTAGYSDGTLYRSGQLNSYPAMLAEQFSIFGADTFRQALLPGESGWPGPKRVLAVTTGCNGATGLSPVLFSGSRADTAGSAMNVSAEGPYNNFGIPGIRAVDYLNPLYGYLNPYAGRIMPAGLVTPLQAVKMNPATFFTIWLGNNDVLGYALSGGEGNPNPQHPDNISDLNAFRAAYDSVVNTMTAGGAKGVLINIPDITAIPFFTTVPRNGLQLDTTNAAALNMAYANTGVSFMTGANNFVIQDLTNPYGFRQIRADEYVLLNVPQDSIRCAGWGSTKPIPKSYVLTSDEVARIRTATMQFNNFIQAEAIAHQLAYVDMNAYLRTLQSGVGFSGITFTPQFVTGGAFSLDGVHLTPRGYALAANEIIRVINAYYGSTIPGVDVARYGGVRFP